MAKLRMVLDVSYDLNGVDIAVMRSNLERMAERAIGEGMLTGNTEAEVDEYSMSVHVTDPASESRERIVVEMSGGLVATVRSDRPSNLEIVFADDDTQGTAHEIVRLMGEDVILYTEEVKHDPAYVSEVFRMHGGME